MGKYVYFLWRRAWQPTPVLFAGESHGQRSLVGYSPWGHTGLDTTEQVCMYVCTCMYVYVCFRTEVLEKALESPLDSKKIKPVNPKGNLPWIFIGRTEGEVLILSLSEAKSWLIGKDPGSGKDWGQERKWAAEDEVLGWHHQLQGHESEQAMGRGEGQGSLACCSPRDCKELEMT